MVTRGNEGSKGNEAFDLSKNRDLPDDTPDINKLDLLSLLGEGPGQDRGNDFLGQDSSRTILDLAMDRAEGRTGSEDMSPHWSRIQQGYIADCHFVASMQAMARQPDGREALKQMIEPLPVGADGKRSWQVTFPGGSHPVTVNEDDLYEKGAIQVGADQEPLPGLAGQWPSVLEAAAGKLWTEQSGPYGPYRNPALQLGHCGDVQWSLQLLTGEPVTAESTRFEMTIKDVNELADSNLLAQGLTLVMGFGRTPHELENAIAGMSGKEPQVIFGRNGHAYTLVGYTPGKDGAEGTFSLRNPWGGNNAETIHDLRAFSDGSRDGVLTLPVSKVQELFDQMYVLQKPIQMRSRL